MSRTSENEYMEFIDTLFTTINFICGIVSKRDLFNCTPRNFGNIG